MPEWVQVLVIAVSGGVIGGAVMFLLVRWEGWHRGDPRP